MCKCVKCYMNGKGVSCLHGSCTRWGGFRWAMEGWLDGTWTLAQANAGRWLILVGREGQERLAYRETFEGPWRTVPPEAFNLLVGLCPGWNWAVCYLCPVHCTGLGATDGWIGYREADFPESWAGYPLKGCQMKDRACPTRCHCLGAIASHVSVPHHCSYLSGAVIASQKRLILSPLLRMWWVGGNFPGKGFCLKALK